AALEVYNDFAEHLPAFDPRQALLEIRQSKLGIDDRRHAGGDLGQAVADIAHRRAERAKYLILLLEQLHQINGNGRARGRAASNQASAALEAEQRGIETFSANVLEHYVDAFLGRELAGDALEALGLVIDDVIGAKRLGLFSLGVIADGSDDDAPDGLCHLDGDRADTGAAGMHENGFPRLELGIVEHHVFGGAEGDRCAGRIAERDAGWHRNDQPRRQIDQIAREAVDMETHDAADVFAQIVAAIAASDAMSTGHGAVHHHFVARLEAGDARADFSDFAGSFRAHHQRQFAFGESHAAKPPQVEMIERDRLDADLYLAVAGRRRGGYV